ncbi:hypothetical protein Fcan01_18855 [Folsomia candida]|uniref:Uncharacterized protein n=1 Tax=Folsomia candida TaxID=158441 RepID=A0A226DN14_FOLCA|nr:hypothetical protein Fcan01_18855 [Folsomia candida]
MGFNTENSRRIYFQLSARISYGYGKMHVKSNEKAAYLFGGRFHGGVAFNVFQSCFSFLLIPSNTAVDCEFRGPSSSKIVLQFFLISVSLIFVAVKNSFVQTFTCISIIGFSWKILLMVSIVFVTYFILPLFLICVLFPLAIYRNIVVWLSTWKKELSGPLSLNDCSWAWDDVYNRPLAAITGHFKSTCTITRWTNVYFCKKCDNFNLHNHIKLNKESDPAKLAEFLNSQISKRFLVGQPLWEIISLPNYTHAKYSTSSAIVIRVHHTIECRSLLYLHNAGIMRPGSRHGRKYCPTLKKYQEKLIFITPRQPVYYFLRGINSQRISPPDSPICRKRELGVQITRASTHIDLNLLKTISKKTGFSVTAVIQAGLTGALRELIVSRGGDPRRDVVSMYILPRLNHPGTLARNLNILEKYNGFARTKVLLKKFCFPLQSPTYLDDRLDRLAWISKEFDHVLHSALPIGLMTTATCVCLLSPLEIGLANSGTYTHSNFNCNLNNPLKMFGHVVETFDLLPGIQAAGNALLIITSSYNGKLIDQLTADKLLFPAIAQTLTISESFRMPHFRETIRFPADDVPCESSCSFKLTWSKIKFENRTLPPIFKRVVQRKDKCHSPINLDDRLLRLAWISKQFDHVLHSALPIGLMASSTCLCLLLAFFGVAIAISNGGTYAHPNVNLNFSSPLKITKM